MDKLEDSELARIVIERAGEKEDAVEVNRVSFGLWSQ